MRSKVSIIIPCYQSVNNIPELHESLIHLQNTLTETIDLEIVIVDDGSTDGSFEAILNLKDKIGDIVTIVKLSGNFGSYAAFLAGLHYASGDCFVQLHVDLQDPPESIPEMIEHWRNGYKLVIGQRTGREEKGLYIHLANLYHWIIKTIALPDIPNGGYDLILFDRILRDEVVEMNQANTNLVYLISSFKFPYVTVPITRKKRIIGESQWTFLRRTKLVIDSIVSFSYFPIRLLTGIAIISISSWIIISLLFFIRQIEMSWMVWLIYTTLNGLLLGSSIIAEYTYRILEAARKRSPFIVDRIIK